MEILLPCEGKDSMLHSGCVLFQIFAPGIPTTLYGRLLSGSYKFPKIYCGVKGVYTNTGMVDAYRGAGRPEATFVVERAMDLVAKKLGMDVLDIRKKKLYSKRSIPLHPGGWNHKRPCL